jgi:hypothetical protein
MDRSSKSPQAHSVFALMRTYNNIRIGGPVVKSVAAGAKSAWRLVPIPAGAEAQFARGKTIKLF